MKQLMIIAGSEREAQLWAQENKIPPMCIRIPTIVQQIYGVQKVFYALAKGFEKNPCYGEPLRERILLHGWKEFKDLADLGARKKETKPRTTSYQRNSVAPGTTYYCKRTKTSGIQVAVRLEFETYETIKKFAAKETENNISQALRKLINIGIGEVV